MKKYKIEISTDDTMRLYFVSSLVHEVMMDLHPDVAKHIRLDNIIESQIPDPFKPRDNDDCECNWCRSEGIRE